MVDYTLATNKLTVDQVKIIKQLAKMATFKSIQSESGLINASINYLKENSMHFPSDGPHVATSKAGSYVLNNQASDSKLRNLNERIDDELLHGYNDSVIERISRVNYKWCDPALNQKSFQIASSKCLGDVVFSAVLVYVRDNMSNFNFDYSAKSITSFKFTVCSWQFIDYNFSKGYAAIDLLQLKINSDDSCTFNLIQREIREFEHIHRIKEINEPTRNHEHDYDDIDLEER